MSDCESRITDYLVSGGLFNPELANHDNVRDLLIDCRAEFERLRAERDAAYTERNRLVALIARLFPSGLKKTDIPGWDPAWHNCVYIDLPTGQASWHFHDNDAHLFAGLPNYHGEWDGHSTDEKYGRVARLTRSWMTC